MDLVYLCKCVCILQLFRTERGCRWRQTNVETAPFYTSKDVDHLIKETEVSCLISV